MSGGLLWGRGEMHGDITHFKELTTGSAVIMGRKTLDSIGVALPNRQNIVVTRGKDIEIPGIKTAHSLEEAFAIADDYKDAFIMGGGEIYKQALNDVEKIYATEVDVSISGADVFFPKLDPAWQKTSEEQFPVDNDNIYPYSFVTYEKR
ncbi:MAG: dihydrofolate reductase [Candidatus Saccharibacteria bacterium]|nr:dihydrofolate reductase [Candidatus Saccharibacteria bacterium]